MQPVQRRAPIVSGPQGPHPLQKAADVVKAALPDWDVSIGTFDKKRPEHIAIAVPKDLSLEDEQRLLQVARAALNDAARSTVKVFLNPTAE